MLETIGENLKQYFKSQVQPHSINNETFEDNQPDRKITSVGFVHSLTQQLNCELRNAAQNVVRNNPDA